MILLFFETQVIMKITVIANHNYTEIESLEKSSDLWIHENDLTKATGFELKPSGACYPKLDICIPLFEKGLIHKTTTGSWLNMSKLSKALELTCIASDDKKAWSLGVIPQVRQLLLDTGKAPDFEIEDIYGNNICLSDFKGKKVLIVTWATWCGCRFDVKSWQKIYEELNDPNFEIICVAEDSQGASVAKKWFLEAKASFKCVIDTQHKISSLFGWVNVPTGAWINEDGQIIRVNEAAYAEKHEIKNLLMKTEFGNDTFGKATKAWIKHGLTKDITQSEEKRKRNTRAQNKNDFEADAWFQLGLFYQDKKETIEAEKYFEKARLLAPNNWNIQRQTWTFKSTFYAIKNWNRITRKSFKNNTNWTYYEPMDLQGAPTRRTTRIVWFWERIGNWFIALFK